MRLFTLVLCLGLTLSGLAQKYVSTEGIITFFSSAKLEDIKADNTKISSLLNVSSSEIAFSVPINQFQFAKKLMQEHFNDKYMESHKYPRSTFTGKLENFDAKHEGEQLVTAVGKLSIHGVTRDVRIPGTVDVRQSQIKVQSEFTIRLEDYSIRIPTLLWQNIAEEVLVTVRLSYKPQQ